MAKFKFEPKIYTSRFHRIRQQTLKNLIVFDKRTIAFVFSRKESSQLVRYVRNKCSRSKKIVNCFLEANLSDRTVLSLIRLKSYFNNMLIFFPLSFQVSSYKIKSDNCTEKLQQESNILAVKKVFFSYRLKCRPCPFIQILSRFFLHFIFETHFIQFYPDFFRISLYSKFIKILSRFYPDFILILS